MSIPNGLDGGAGNVLRSYSVKKLRTERPEQRDGEMLKKNWMRRLQARPRSMLLREMGELSPLLSVTMVTFGALGPSSILSLAAADSARCLPSFLLKSSEPRSSVWPMMVTLVRGFEPLKLFFMRSAISRISRMWNGLSAALLNLKKSRISESRRNRQTLAPGDRTCGLPARRRRKGILLTKRAGLRIPRNSSSGKSSG